jgi:hypothetical protein
MSKLQDLPNKAAPADTDQVYLFDAAGAAKDNRVSIAAVRGITKTETLTNKTINTPATAKPIYGASMQLPGAKLTGFARKQDTISIGILAAGAEITGTVAVAGLAIGDAVICNPRSLLETGVNFAYAWASAPDTLSVRIRNTGTVATSGNIIPVDILAFRNIIAD